MSRAVIVAGVRTPITKARKGKFAAVDARFLAEKAIGAALVRSRIPTHDIEDIVLAESLQGGSVIARYAAVNLGMSQVPGLAVNRHCAGGLGAVQTAVSFIRAGANDVLIAGGTESMSSMPVLFKPGADGQLQPWPNLTHPDRQDAPAMDMSITVGENTAKTMGLTRRDVDEWAAYSQGRAIYAIDNGHFDAEIIGVEAPQLDGSLATVTLDEQPRRGTTVESLGELKVLHPEIENPTVTAGNAAGLNDAAAALMIVSEEYAAAHGLTPLGTVREWGVSAVDPYDTGLAPIPAIEKALAKSKLGIGDIASWEINEAFCAVPVAATRKLGIDPSLVNVNGSGASIGHPIAATGARMVVTMLNELKRQDAQFGVVSMCAGGGMGSALVVERL
ncbi:MAG TPA: thiolase family protein [Jatrophihabitans sp.]|jgi:acetyl-CoA C-acetyltransferase